ncbi:hypothetical protein GOP47_0003482 [Adiantum capillus-veneris]|uniref:Metallo-beta-lactamase domain-containing protein n=1 Tax=Adiantum capillus-veneris TaxID=13818 RepID=A0A9D4ZQ37_ADICA|nr:hypothetical protein GOP47_0003482 [Adiantum capillus-veneris]
MALRFPYCSNSCYIFRPIGNHGDHPSSLKHKQAAIRCSSARSARRPQNVPGEFYVDHTCIDCDVCRWMAPNSFTRVESQSAVYNQPSTSTQRVAALQALLSCPTASIHTETPPADILQAHSTFPIPIHEDSLPGVYHCGYHSKKSFAAASYFIKRPGGNILVDSPRYSERLAQNLQELGGVDYFFLTHKDDVADHDRWQKRFNCPRILHEQEVTADTAGVEIKLKGKGPWDFLGPDIDLLFFPGHTEASVCLHLKPLKVLFSGDSIANIPQGYLHVDPNFNWYSVDIQMESIKTLLPLDFLWILPGHGRRAKYNNVEEKNKAINDLLDSVYVRVAPLPSIEQNHLQKASLHGMHPLHSSTK